MPVHAAFSPTTTLPPALIASMRGRVPQHRQLCRAGRQTPSTGLPLLCCPQVRYQDDPLVVQRELSRLTSLRALWLQHAAFEAPAVVGALPRLRTLALVGGAAGWAAVLQGLIAAAGHQGTHPGAAGEAGGGQPAAAQAPRAGGAAAADAADGPAAGCGLHALHLQAHAQSVAEVPGEVWLALVQLPAGLTRLELPYNRLRGLPEGPYLRELRVGGAGGEEGEPVGVGRGRGGAQSWLAATSFCGGGSRTAGLQVVAADPAAAGSPQASYIGPAGSHTGLLQGGRQRRAAALSADLRPINSLLCSAAPRLASAPVCEHEPPPRPMQALDLSHNSLPGVPAHLPGCCPHLSALSLGQQETASPGEGAADVAVLRALPTLRLLVTSAGHYSASYLSSGLRSPAEAAHLGRLRAALPPRCRVTNRQGEWERAAGRLAALFEVSVRQRP